MGVLLSNNGHRTMSLNLSDEVLQVVTKQLMADGWMRKNLNNSNLKGKVVLEELSLSAHRNKPTELKRRQGGKERLACFWGKVQESIWP